MRAIGSCLVICLLVAVAPVSTAHNHLKLFDTTKNITNASLISWETVDNVQARCEEESRKRGLGGFGINLEACSFWGKRLGVDVCHIITEKRTNIDTLGHEVRHCFQGSFH